MRGFIPSCNNKTSIWKIPLTKNTKCEKEPSFSAFEWFERIQHWPWQPHERGITMKGASPLCLLLSEDPGLHTPQDRAALQRRKHWMFISSSHHLLSHSPFSSALSTSLSHPALQASLCQYLSPLPCLLSELCFSCFHAPHSLFSDSGYWLLQWYWLLFLHHQCCHCHMHWSPCPCLALPPTCPSPTCFSSGCLASLLGVWVG